MAGRIPHAFVDTLLERVDIVELINRRVPLTKAGHEYRACCPFHDEKTPSFYVSPKKQFFHCFGCGEHGTALGFLMKYEHLDFLDAIEELAQQLGLELPRADPRAVRQDDQRAALQPVLEAVSEHYRAQLARSARARDYLAQRGLTPATIAQFGLGYSVDADALARALGPRCELAERAGALGRSQSGRGWYDRFRGRLMFPIHDRRGRVIAFGGRLIETGAEGPKYLNSPETPLFHKGRELYGLAQMLASRVRRERVIVVEGYMDVLALHQAGYTEAVATLGTSTSVEHIETLYRLKPEIIFCFDGDNAGRRAAWRALQGALSRLRDGRHARFLFLPEGQDPDSVLRDSGPAAFEALLAKAEPLSTVLLRHLAQDLDLSTADGRARFADLARPELSRIPEGSFREAMVDAVREYAGVAWFQLAKTATPVATVKPLIWRSEARSLVAKAIALLLNEPSLASSVGPVGWLERLKRPGAALLAGLISQAAARPGLPAAALVEHYVDDPSHGPLRRLLQTPLLSAPEEWADEFSGALAKLRAEARSERVAELLARSASGAMTTADADELRALLADRETLAG